MLELEFIFKEKIPQINFDSVFNIFYLVWAVCCPEPNLATCKKIVSLQTGFVPCLLGPELLGYVQRLGQRVPRGAHQAGLHQPRQQHHLKGSGGERQPRRPARGLSEGHFPADYVGSPALPGQAVAVSWESPPLRPVPRHLRAVSFLVRVARPREGDPHVDHSSESDRSHLAEGSADLHDPVHRRSLLPASVAHRPLRGADQATALPSALLLQFQQPFLSLRRAAQDFFQVASAQSF